MEYKCTSECLSVPIQQMRNVKKVTDMWLRLENSIYNSSACVLQNWNLDSPKSAKPSTLESHSLGIWEREPSNSHGILSTSLIVCRKLYGRAVFWSPQDTHSLSRLLLIVGCQSYVWLGWAIFIFFFGLTLLGYVLHQSILLKSYSPNATLHFSQSTSNAWWSRILIKEPSTFS